MFWSVCCSSDPTPVSLYSVLGEEERTLVNTKHDVKCLHKYCMFSSIHYILSASLVNVYEIIMQDMFV